MGEEASTLESTVRETMNGLRRSNSLLESTILGRERAESELLQLATLEDSTAAHIGAFHLVISCSKPESKGDNCSFIYIKYESLHFEARSWKRPPPPRSRNQQVVLQNHWFR